MTRTPAGSPRPVLKGLAFLAILGGIIALARLTGLEEHLADRAWLMDHVQGRGLAGYAFFVGLTALATGMGLPRQITAFLGGLAFGALWGTLLATLGTALGCAADFTLARTLGREFVLHRFGGRVAKLDAFLSTGPFRTSLAIRLLPVGHNLLTSVAAGVTSIPMLPFLAGSAVGYLPQNLVFALFGAGLGADSGTGRALSVGMSVVLLLGSAWLGMSVYRAYKRQGVDMSAVEDEEE